MCTLGVFTFFFLVFRQQQQQQQQHSQRPPPISASSPLLDSTGEREKERESPSIVCINQKLRRARISSIWLGTWGPTKTE